MMKKTIFNPYLTFKCSFCNIICQDELSNKVRSSKGRALFIVYVWLSKYKLDRLRNGPSINKLFVWILINIIVHLLRVFYVPCFGNVMNVKKCVKSYVKLCKYIFLNAKCGLAILLLDLQFLRLLRLTMFQLVLKKRRRRF